MRRTNLPEYNFFKALSVLFFLEIRGVITLIVLFLQNKEAGLFVLIAKIITVFPR